MLSFIDNIDCIALVLFYLSIIDEMNQINNFFSPQKKQTNI